MLQELVSHAERGILDLRRIAIGRLTLGIGVEDAVDAAIDQLLHRGGDFLDLRLVVRLAGSTGDGEPYRWDPCSTIHFQVDLGGVDDHVLDDVKEAVRRVSQASGLRFEFDGVVHLSVNDLLSSGDFVTASGGLHWSPLLIAFRSQTAMRGLGVRGAYGVAFPVTTRLDADQFVSGAVVINASAGLQDGFDRAPSVGTVLQHELGHAVGLGHILDPFQLMSPVPVVTDWGRGDLAGLEELGEGPCLDVPTAEYQAAIHPTP